MPSIAELNQILKIGYDTSSQGEMSMDTAIRNSNYVNLRKEFDYKDLIPIIERNPNLVGEWTLFSEDKRTSGGFYLKDDEIGSVRDGFIDRISNDSERIAKYVIMELDFWATFQ